MTTPPRPTRATLPLLAEGDFPPLATAAVSFAVHASAAPLSILGAVVLTLTLATGAMPALPFRLIELPMGRSPMGAGLPRPRSPMR